MGSGSSFEQIRDRPVLLCSRSIGWPPARRISRGHCRSESPSFVVTQEGTVTATVERVCGAWQRVLAEVHPRASFFSSKRDRSVSPPAAAASRQTGLPASHDPLQLTHLEAPEVPSRTDPGARRGPLSFWGGRDPRRPGVTRTTSRGYGLHAWDGWLAPPRR